MNCKYVVIINPVSGKKIKSHHRELIIQSLQNQNIEFEIDSSEHLLTYDRTQVRLKSGYRNFIVVGGDGTLNQFVNAIFKQTAVNPADITLCFIPLGTGNDWRRTTGVPLNLTQAIGMLTNGQKFKQDVGKVTYFQKGVQHTHYFANIAGMAYDAYVNYHTTLGDSKKKLGKFSYLLKILSCLFSYQKSWVDYSIDGKKFGYKVFSICVGICKYNGNGVMQIPHAVPDDGDLSVTIIGNLSTWEVLMQMPKMYSGKFVQHPKVQTFSCKKISVESDPKIYLECDGEQLGHSPFDFEVMPLALNVLLP
jgi:YegS/Rv2252/BmrU family lipid kinase